MRDRTHPTFEEISLFYDGLLEGEEKARVEAYLAAEGASNPLPDLFETFACVQEELDLPEAEVDRLLSGNLQEIHSRIYGQDRRQESGWLVFLTPKFLVGAVALVMVIAGTTAILQSGGPAPSGSAVALGPDANAPEEENAPEEDSFARSDVQVSEVQKQVILAMAQYAKTAVSSGVETVAEQSREVTKTLTDNMEDPRAAMAVDAVRTAFSRPAASAPSQPDGASPADPAAALPANALAKFGRQQVALGLGASMISMISVF